VSSFSASAKAACLVISAKAGTQRLGSLRQPSRRPLNLVIPAKAGIQLLPLSLLLIFSVSRNPPHVLVRFARIHARESLSLACPRESNQREGHPCDRGRRASCPATARGRCGGSLTAHPCADSELAGILPATLRAFSSAPSPRPRGTPEAKAERGVLPQKRCSLRSLDWFYRVGLGPPLRTTAVGRGPPYKSLLRF